MNLVEVKNNQVVTTSRQVAENFRKQHKHVLASIQKLTSAQFSADVSKINEMFFEATEPDTYGRKQKIYYMNRDGFSLLVMGFTGRKAIEWKVKYIQAFNQMEQALKERQSSVPVPVLKRVTWHGNIVMTAIQLQQLTGFNRATMRARAKAEGLRYFLLMDVDAKLFREENKLTDKVGRRIIYPQGSVIMLLKLLGLYQKLKEHIEEYFRIGKYTPKPPTQKVSCNTKPVQEAIEIISEKLLTMNGLLKQLPDYKRKPEEHENIVKIAEELGISVFTELQKLQTQIHTISL